MRLIELDPHWWIVGDNRHGQGIYFLCPHCRKEYIGVAFKNPIDGGTPAPDCKYYWTRAGETFDDLTLEPSIDASKVGHWHGHIKGGTMMGTECNVILDLQNGEVIFVSAGGEKK